MILFLLDLGHLRRCEHRLDFLQCRAVIRPYLVMLLFIAERAVLNGLFLVPFRDENWPDLILLTLAEFQPAGHHGKILCDLGRGGG